MCIRTLPLIAALVFGGVAVPAAAGIQEGLDALDAGNVAEAASEFQQSFQDGDGDGAFYLGRLFEFGLGAEKDMNRAANLYAAAAQAGSVSAMNRLGLLYLEGTTLLKDYNLARVNFCNAADTGDQNGLLNCALMLRDGRGGEVDAAGAATRLQGAADQGNIAAKNILATMVLAGEGVEADQGRAIELFTETADAGNAMGLFELAKFYASAEDGREADLVQAYSYANLAAVRNMAEALTFRDGLEEQMSNAQVNEGQKLSQDWTAQRIAEQANAGGETTQ